MVVSKDPMFKRGVGVFAGLVASFGILFVSIVKASSPSYQFNPPSLEPPETKTENTASKDILIDYQLPDPGDIMPGNPLWYAVAAADKVKLEGITDPVKKAQSILEMADKRLSVGCKLFSEGKFEESVLTFQKSEKYLGEAFSNEAVARLEGRETSELLLKLHKASAFHIYDLEKHLTTAPEDARPILTKILDLPKKVFEDTRNLLSDIGVKVDDFKP